MSLNIQRGRDVWSTPPSHESWYLAYLWNEEGSIHQLLVFMNTEAQLQRPQGPSLLT